MNAVDPVVKILPGVPAMDGLEVDATVPYPDSTTDFVKVLGSLGLNVEFTEPREKRRYVGHKAWEVWLPILQMSIEVLVAFEAGLLVEIVKSYLGDEDEPALEGVEPLDAPDRVSREEVAVPLLHVDWRVTMQDGHEERFVANGDAESVRDALESFERHVRDL